MKATLITLALAGMTLGGCAQVQDVVTSGRTYSAYTASALVQSECALSLDVRKDNAKAVSDRLAKDGSPAKFTLDCDGNGQPDF